MNFSNINLENNYSLTRRDLVPILIYEEEGSEVVKCSIMWDRDIHVLYKKVSRESIVLEEFRENAGLSLRRLADLMGLSFMRVHQMAWHP